MEAFSRIDVLLGSTSEGAYSMKSLCQFHVLICHHYLAVVGAIEELAQSSRTISLVQETFETNFFANVNIIKAVLPVMRQRKNGHIVMLTGISKVS